MTENQRRHQWMASLPTFTLTIELHTLESLDEEDCQFLCDWLELTQRSVRRCIRHAPARVPSGGET